MTEQDRVDEVMYRSKEALRWITRAVYLAMLAIPALLAGGFMWAINSPYGVPTILASIGIILLSVYCKWCSERAGMGR